MNRLTTIVCYLILSIGTLWARTVQYTVIAETESTARYIAIREIAKILGEEVQVVSGELILPPSISNFRLISKEQINSKNYEFVFVAEKRDHHPVNWEATFSYIIPFVNFLIFPGFLFTTICGILASFIDRKITARVQWRHGPPLLQPLYDLIKLIGKEVMIPEGVSKTMFILLPIISLSSVVLLGIMSGVILQGAIGAFKGDLIVAIYLMAVPAICLILSGSISRNPLASIGASREMKLILAYEVPFVLSLIVPIIKSGGKIVITEIIEYQATTAPIVFSLSGIIAFLLAILCLQSKLGLVPFDVSEAEQEIMSGVLIEHSGFPLAAYKLTRMMMLFVYPLFLVKLFWYSRTGTLLGDILLFSLKYFVILVIVVLIRNTNPRVRIDQAIKFFWSYGLIIGIISIILALIGV